MKKYFINRVTSLLSRITLSCLDKDLTIVISYDKRTTKFLRLLGYTGHPSGEEPRVYIKVTCTTACRQSGEQQLQHGRKWYLSEHMTDDEIIKTAYAAFQRFIAHEAAEGFLVDKKPLFNPHVDFEELLKICEKEVKRDDSKATVTNS